MNHSAVMTKSGHCVPRIIAPITSGSCKDPSDGGTTHYQERRYNDFLQLLMDAADENSRTVQVDAVEDEMDQFGSITSDNGLSTSGKYKSLSEDELLAQCILFFMVGYETTATVLTFLAYCLAVNPEWQEKLIKEVDEAFQNHKEMSYDAVRDMKVLDAVLSETLRMHPPAAS
ncbi:Cytochrome P450 3A29 [Araneus ventricosus]|uniref:Cytochrome P450 3A29 n=1 Tax=Araneus ventricosus TaxID=182803 RepID=A0A4Y2V248_ARAVE|nr:Cytochrome P450 3A29 [Araneus ventricosus]